MKTGTRVVSYAASCYGAAGVVEGINEAGHVLVRINRGGCVLPVLRCDLEAVAPDDADLCIAEEAAHQRAAIRYGFPLDPAPERRARSGAAPAAAGPAAAAPAGARPLCIWCAMERALQGQGPARLALGLQTLSPCSRHS